MEAIPYVYGNPITPCALADAQGNVSVIMVGHLSKLCLFVPPSSVVRTNRRLSSMRTRRYEWNDFFAQLL